MSRGNIRLSIGSNPRGLLAGERVLVSTRESSIHGNRGPKLFGILDLFFGNERELDTFRLIPR